MQKLLEVVKQKIKHVNERIIVAVKWALFSIFSGISIGIVGTLLYLSTRWVTDFRLSHGWLIGLLPICGIAIVGMYHLTHDEKDTGTNLVLSAIHSGEEIPLKMAPLIFLATVMTHLFGGSAGREGASLQLGGSIGNALGRWFRFDEKDQHIMIMCGMSAAFSALFGTPMAAAIFAMEVVSVGIMYYAALVPCVIAALIAHGVALQMGALPEVYDVSIIPDFSVRTGIMIAILAIGCAAVSILFCVVLHDSEKIYRKILKNPYIRAAVGGCIIVVLTLIVGSQRYNGVGTEVIQACMSGEGLHIDFLLKIIFTALTLGAGFKGGEIIPSFYIGAAFGCLFAQLTGMSPLLCSAVGMGAVFCGVTNCPITSLLICFEMFGMTGMPYYLLAIALSYMLSGYYGLYSSQKIIYSKYKTIYINRKTH